MTKLSAADTCKILGIKSVKTLYNKISLGVGPEPIRENGRLYFTIDALMEFMIKRDKRQRGIVESHSVNDNTSHDVAV